MGIIENFYAKQFIHRYEEQPVIKYFCAEDFDRLSAEEYQFKSDENTLKGNFYSYPDAIEDTLVIFVHGIGAGHHSYMKEIEKLCKAGYKVLSYDNTGCVASEGDSIRGMSQSLCDLDNAIKSLKESGEFYNYDNVYVIGHSWGAYATGNIAKYHNDIKKAVVISGFASVKLFIKGLLHGARLPVFRYICKQIVTIERKANPDYADACFLDSVKQNEVKFLFVHDEHDNLVPINCGLGFVKNNFNADNISYIVTNGKMHNPVYTSDAVSYMNTTIKAITKAFKKLKDVDAVNEKFKHVDWHAMTAQDDSVWDEILAFLAK